MRGIVPRTDLGGSMTIRKAALAAFTLVLAVLVAACSHTYQGTASESVQTVSVMTDHTADIDKIKTEFVSIKSRRGVSEGWAVDVRPGSTRSAETITQDLMELERLQGELDSFGFSDQTSILNGEIREVMLDDLRLLLRVAKQERELNALNAFLRIAPKLDTSLEADFGTSSEELREEAVKIAKSEVAKMRPRLREGSADASGWLTQTLQEWQFTPQEIGLTAQDMKSLAQ